MNMISSLSGIGLVALGLFTLGVSLTPYSAAAQNTSLGPFDGQTTIGAVEDSGAATYDAETQKYTIEGAGSYPDGLHVVWTRISGDFIVRAEVADENPSARVLGWTVRSQLDADVPHVNAAVQGDGQSALHVRRASDDEPTESPVSVPHPDVIQLERTGDAFLLSAARHGDTFTTEQVSDVTLGDSVYVGLFVSSGPEGERATAAFRNVRIIKPAPENLATYEEYLGSNLEILNVDTGHREIVHRSPESLQAPNWTPDGEALIYNHNGLLYRFDLATRTPEVIDTGFADDNNNDHVISFDGTQLGISHHADEHDGNSIIYTVPIGGGTPRQVTPKGPAYLHGWSPDGDFLTYTGARNGAYDIYKIPVDGGEEIRLTRAEGLDDGSEYTPNGEYIYFNSVRTGSMEIWRMRPDGSGKEQLTDDRFNNWFPHISPDGERIVFLSYRSDVPPGDHPFYKQVYLRMMPIDGGTPEVVAYVYGGQGTINVPSWSPDGTRVGFVSNTGTH